MLVFGVALLPLAVALPAGRLGVAAAEAAVVRVAGAAEPALLADGAALVEAAALADGAALVDAAVLADGAALVDAAALGAVEADPAVGVVSPPQAVSTKVNANSSVSSTTGLATLRC